MREHLRTYNSDVLFTHNICNNNNNDLEKSPPARDNKNKIKAKQEQIVAVRR